MSIWSSPTVDPVRGALYFGNVDTTGVASGVVPYALSAENAAGVWVSGLSENLLVDNQPVALSLSGPAVASSIKTDLLAATSHRREQLGTVFVFDPFALAGTRSHTWSPLGGATTWDGALEVAWRLAAAGELDQRGVEGGDFWAVAAEQRLAPLLFAAAQTGGRIEDVVRWAYGQGARDRTMDEEPRDPG